MNIAIKPTYLFLFSAIALASCSQDDVPARVDGDGSRSIVFRASLPELTSRAAAVNQGNLKYFCVTAFDFDDPAKVSEGVMQTLFDNEKIDIVAGKKNFSSPYCCWPDEGKESDLVTFFGFYPGLEEIDGARLVNTSTATDVDYKLTGFRVAPDIADHVDFITAYTTGKMADNLFSGITLPFVHQLSRIEVKACGAHESCDIEIAGVRIGGVGVEATFDFKPIDRAGEWLTPERGIVEYVFRNGDKIVSCGSNHKVEQTAAISIMGSKRGDNAGDNVNDKDNDNCAMLIPANYAAWDAANDPRNGSNQMYISVLLRVTDATLTAGVNPAEKQRYPYRDLSQGADALNVPIVYLAVDKASGEVATRLYKNGSGYFTDSDCKNAYNLPATEEVKEFGWAALPVTGDWAPGKIYTYTLDYTLGVGLHDPAVSTTAPKAGDPVISDKVGITYTVKEWQVGGGSDFPVPGS